MRAIVAMLALLAGCGPDYCAEPAGDPSVTIGGADMAGARFEAFEPGAQRPLVFGEQGGMHVWMSLRLSGMCPETTNVERRVVGEEGMVRVFGRGLLMFASAEPDGTFELSSALAMGVCPDPLGRPVIGEPLRFVVSASDAEGRRAEHELAFVPACASGDTCDAFCTP
jgi:hypothetical protein